MGLRVDHLDLRMRLDDGHNLGLVVGGKFCVPSTALCRLVYLSVIVKIDIRRSLSVINVLSERTKQGRGTQLRIRQRERWRSEFKVEFNQSLRKSARIKLGFSSRCHLHHRCYPSLLRCHILRRTISSRTPTVVSNMWLVLAVHCSVIVRSRVCHHSLFPHSSWSEHCIATAF